MGEKRNFLGETPDERKGRRRLELIDAALTLVHEGGLSALGVRSVITHANLASRYFYESFANTDELLIGATQSVAQELLGVGLEALLARELNPGTATDDEILGRFRDGITAALSVLLEDPRKASLLAAAWAGGTRVNLEVSQHLTSLVAATITGEAGASQVGFDDTSTLYVAGGLVSLTMAFVSGQLDITRTELVDRLARFTLGVIKVGAEQTTALA